MWFEAADSEDWEDLNKEDCPCSRFGQVVVVVAFLSASEASYSPA